jgi:predicted RNA-binding protein with PUA-like domain
LSTPSAIGFWLLKTEPDEFGWADLVAVGAGGEPWTGVRNHQAKNFLAAMRQGDRAFIHHTGDERQIVGIATIAGPSLPDPTDPAWIAVPVVAEEKLARPVTLAAIKQVATADPQGPLAAMLLVRNPRLSVQPVTEQQWQAVLRLAGHERLSLPA